MKVQRAFVTAVSSSQVGIKEGFGLSRKVAGVVATLSLKFIIQDDL